MGIITSQDGPIYAHSNAQEDGRQQQDGHHRRGFLTDPHHDTLSSKPKAAENAFSLSREFILHISECNKTSSANVLSLCRSKGSRVSIQGFSSHISRDAAARLSCSYAKYLNPPYHLHTKKMLITDLAC